MTGDALAGEVLSNFDSNLQLPRHRWYRVREGFSRQLVEMAIREVDLVPRSMVVDPFCGSGTTCLTAVELGMNSFGIEVNPFLSFVAKAKLSRLSSDRLRKFGDELFITPVPSLLEGYSTFSSKSGSSKWLFNTNVLRAFQSIWEASGTVPGRGLVRLAAIGAAMDCSNAVKDGKGLRYRSDWRDLNFNDGHFAQRFADRLNIICSDLDSLKLSEGVDASIVMSDSRGAMDQVPQFDLCVTSPPYLNSFDYSDIYRPELFLGGFVSDNRALAEIRHRTVRSHVQSAWETPAYSINNPHLDQVLEALEERKDLLWNSRLRPMVAAYFEDMKRILQGLEWKLRRNGQIWMVVSTSAYAGIEVPVDLILAEIGTQVGLRLLDVHVMRHIRTAGQHRRRFPDQKPPLLRESLIIWGKRGHV